MQQFHQQMSPDGITYACATTLDDKGKSIIDSKPVLTQSALDGFSSIPTQSLKLLAEV